MFQFLKFVSSCCCLSITLFHLSPLEDRNSPGQSCKTRKLIPHIRGGLTFGSCGLVMGALSTVFSVGSHRCLRCAEVTNPRAAGVAPLPPSRGGTDAGSRARCKVAYGRIGEIRSEQRKRTKQPGAGRSNTAPFLKHACGIICRKRRPAPSHHARGRNSGGVERLSKSSPARQARRRGWAADDRTARATAPKTQATYKARYASARARDVPPAPAFRGR